MPQRKRTVFPKEFKLEAVRLVLEKGMSGAQVARILGWTNLTRPVPLTSKGTSAHETEFIVTH